MNMQERKRYNFVIFLLYAIFFFVYGGLGLWMHMDGAGPFSELPPLIGVILSIVVAGLMGGWLVAGIVGGVWLGSKFIGRQSKKFIVLACVFAPFTFFAFIYVGIFAAIPFAIYNFITIRRSCVSPESVEVNISYKDNNATTILHEEDSPHQAAPGEYFSSKSIINRDAYEEFKWHFISKNEKLMCGIIIFCSVMVVIFGVGERYYAFILLGILGLFVTGIRLVVTPEQIVKINLQRTQEATGFTDVEVITSFTDEKIKIYNVTTGNTTHLSYDAINRLAETKNMYILFSKANQFALVNKTTLMQEQKTEAFTWFLRDKCKHIKW